MMDRDGPGRDLDALDALHALVSSDPAGAPVEGRVSVGIRARGGDTRWWSVAMSRTSSRAGFHDSPPPSDVALVMDNDTARGLLVGRLPALPGLLAIEGDAALLGRFVERYVRPRSWLDLRMGR